MWGQPICKDKNHLGFGLPFEQCENDWRGDNREIKEGHRQQIKETVDRQNALIKANTRKRQVGDVMYYNANKLAWDGVKWIHIGTLEAPSPVPEEIDVHGPRSIDNGNHNHQRAVPCHPECREFEPLKKIREKLNEVGKFSTEKQEAVDHPQHYNSHPSGLECIEVVRHLNFNVGNAMKYLWRCGLKDGETDIKDLSKAIWYLKDEIERLRNTA